MSGQIVPALDLHPHDPDYRPTLPANLEAEQALLGAAMFDNEAVHLVDDLDGSHFYEPLHGRLWDTIKDKVGKGVRADPILLADSFASEPAFEELGGVRYLADLLDMAPPSANAPDYAQAVKETAQRRELLKLAEEISRAARAGEASTEIIGQAESSLLAMTTTSRQLTLVTAGEAADAVMASLYAPADERIGVLTGIEPLDDHLGPLLAGDLILIMGRPSMGKSALASCIALNMAQAGYGAEELNGEMSAEQMTRRHLTDMTHARWGFEGPKYSDIRRRQVTTNQREMLRWASEQIATLPLKMLKRSGLRMSQVRSLSRRQVAEWNKRGVPMGALFIDHVGLLKPDQPSRDRYADQTAISNGLKELADELRCPIVALNQMNRQNENREDKRPQLADLRDSGSWEQDADFVIGCYREAYYAQRQPEPKQGAPGSKEDAVWAEWDRARRSQVVEAIILKAREGETTTVKLWGDVARNAIRGSAPVGGLV